MSKDCNPIEQQARQYEIDRLYELDGRNNTEHPLHATYTALHEISRTSNGANSGVSEACSI